ncbi:PA-phosphatase [Natronococcus pandeyae]|uniref:PA-phosphatase n=1 Tax=Natronococcus pandeyae TaxID=2055836 RepID=A0A8J8PWZ4_9EURY|nr:phosphatase PAP2 family protein [Natronococcus pandeyae]TYL35990.1 PA-phosphatase [Natronococcus pandeyae]
MDRDLGVTEAVRRTVPEWTVSLFDVIALLGDEYLVVAVLLGIATAEAVRSVRRGADRPLSRRTGFVLAIVLGGLALTLVLKSAFGFSRPPESMQAIPREGEGFPSGHTMAATILWGALALWSTTSTRRRRLLGAAILVGLVGLSRLVIGVHYFVDIVASVGFGATYLLAAEAALDGDPERAFAVAVALGGLALFVTGGATDGLLAFAGCAGGAVGWWTLNRPAVRNLWAGLAQ